MPTKSRNRRSPKKLARRMSSKTTRHLSRRKGSARARNPKKLRGGVTTRRRLSQLRQQELSTASVVDAGLFYALCRGRGSFWRA